MTFLPIDDDKRTYTPTEAAELLGVTPPTVLRYLALGRIGHTRLSRREIRISAADIEAFLAAARCEVAS
jgi:excisionase family DNA binding protein